MTDTTNDSFAHLEDHRAPFDGRDFSAPLHELVPEAVRAGCSGKMVDAATWAASPSFLAGARALFRDATPLALACAWLEPYRERAGRSRITFTDGAVLRFDRGRFAGFEPGAVSAASSPTARFDAAKARFPVVEGTWYPAEWMARPCEASLWLAPGRILVGPAPCPGDPGYTGMLRVLGAFGVTAALELGETPAGVWDGLAAIAEAGSFPFAAQRQRGCRSADGGAGSAGACEALDAIREALPECGVLYVAGSHDTTRSLAGLWHLRYSFDSHFHAFDESPGMPQPCGRALLEEMALVCAAG